MNPEVGPWCSAAGEVPPQLRIALMEEGWVFDFRAEARGGRLTWRFARGTHNVAVWKQSGMWMWRAWWSGRSVRASGPHSWIPLVDPDARLLRRYLGRIRSYSRGREGFEPAEVKP